MNKNDVNRSIRALMKDHNVIDIQTAGAIFWIDYFCKLINRSKYKDKFILKGGFLISMIFGIQNRTTRDIDLSSNGESSKDEIETILNELVLLAKEDEVEMTVFPLQPRTIDTGFSKDKRSTKLCMKIKLMFTVQSGGGNPSPRKDIISIDFAEPEDINSKEQSFNSIISGDKITFKAYTVETIMAEKIHATWFIYKSNREPTRARDWFDLAFFNLYKKDLFDYESLIESINKTFKWRGDTFDINEFNEAIDYIQNNGESHFMNLISKTMFDFKFETVIESIRDLSKNIAKYINK